MGRKIGYSITTYKLRLYCSHEAWLYKTRDMYNLILGFYYEVLQKEPELSTMPKRELLRQLEILTIGARGQEKENVKYPLSYGKVPLYFRRAAISDAIRLYQSLRTRKDMVKESQESAGSTSMRATGGSSDREITCPEGGFHTSPIFYKGMYRDFTDAGISLKLWNGEKWVWEACTLDLCKRTLPEPEKRLSPALKLEKGKAMLHVPVVRTVEDTQTVKERLPQTQRICAAAFPGNDCMAVLVVLDKEGQCTDTLFLRGGSQLEHEKKRILSRIRKNREGMGYHQNGRGELGSLEQDSLEQDSQLPEDENRQLKEKIRQLTDTYAHKISRQIVDFCKEKEISILVVPNYKQSIHMNALGYLSATSYDWLGRRIIGQLRYKAFAEGIVVTSVSPKDTASRCCYCGSMIKRFNKENKPGRNYYGGNNYICPNGHKGNAYFNAAVNVGRRFLKSQAEMQG